MKINNVLIVKFASELLSCKKEMDLFHRLTSFAKSVRHKSSRVYLVNRCPFKPRLIYSLAVADPAHTKQQIGYKIEVPSILDSDAYAIERASVAMPDTDKAIWIKELGLESSEWIDLALHSGGERVGLWSLSRKESKSSYTDEEIATLLFLASVASSQIEKFRSLATLKARSVFTDEGNRPRTQEAENTQFLDNILEKIRQTLSAQFVAYYQWNPASGILQKNAETSAVVGNLKTEPDYPPGYRLTGTAYKNKDYRFIPFFEHLRDHPEELADPHSIALHEEVSGSAIKSVMYVPVEPLGTCPGLLRVINRIDYPQLPFQEHDVELLQLLGQFFEKALSIKEASAILENLHAALGIALNFERTQDELFSEVDQQTRRLGFDGLSVIYADANGRIIPKRCWPDILSKRLVKLVSSKSELLLPTMRNEQLEAISNKTENEARLFLQFIGEKKTALHMQFSHFEGRTLIFLPNPLEAPGNQRADAYWRKHQALKNSLRLLLELCKHGILMRANRDAVRNAEMAVAVIAHEFRSPSIALRSQANTLAENTERLFKQNNFQISTPIRVRLTEQGFTTMVSSMDDLRRYLSNTRSLVKEADSRLARAVKDGLLWARMSSNVIELIFEQRNFRELVEASVAELSLDVARRKNIDVHFEIDQNLPEIVIVPDMIQALLVNLLDNAIKYSYASETVYVSARIEGGVLKLEVRNIGLGIDELDLLHIFAPFYRARVRDVEHPVRGVGLGLSTCKKIVQLHGGTISVTSEPTFSDPVRTKRMEGFETTFFVRIRADIERGRRDVLIPDIK